MTASLPFDFVQRCSLSNGFSGGKVNAFHQTGNTIEINGVLSGAPIFFAQNDKISPCSPFNLQDFVIFDAGVHLFIECFSEFIGSRFQHEYHFENILINRVVAADIDGNNFLIFNEKLQSDAVGKVDRYRVQV